MSQTTHSCPQLPRSATVQFVTVTFMLASMALTFVGGFALGCLVASFFY